MDRLTGKDAKLMMEALASVYVKEEVDQEVISEEIVELEENRGRRAAELRAAREAKAAEQDKLYRAGGGDAKRQETRQMQGASSVRARRPGMTRDQVIELGRKNLAAKDSTSTSTGTAPAAPANNAAASKAPAPKPAANPNVTAGGTKFERRLPTMAELRAAQQARRDAPKVLSRGEIENSAVRAGVGVAKGTVKDPKIAADAARKAELAALQAKAKADTLKKKSAPSVPAMSGRARMREELDVFDTIKEYLIGEGATEEEALQQMLALTDEQRTEIIEGSCGSKKKKKGGKK